MYPAVLLHACLCSFTAGYCLVQVPEFSDGQAQTIASLSMKCLLTLLGQTVKQPPGFF